MPSDNTDDGDDTDETAGLLTAPEQPAAGRHPDRSAHRPRRAQQQRLLFAMIFVATCFGCLFAGYSTLEILGTTFRGDLGYYSLMMVYAGITPGSFISPLVVGRIGCRRSMVAGALPYSFYAAANWAVELGAVPGWVLLPSGFSVGLGCGMLWGAQGLYLVQLATEYDRLSPPGAAGSVGLFSGAGGAGTPLGGLLALAGSSALMQRNVPNATIMLCLFLILALGNMLLLALPAVPTRRSSGSGGGDSKQPQPQRPTFSAIPRLLASSRQLCLLMICTLSSGYANAFMSGSFTLDVVTPTLGPAWVGYVLATRNATVSDCGQSFPAKHLMLRRFLVKTDGLPRQARDERRRFLEETGPKFVECRAS
jgi:MFS family permease